MKDLYNNINSKYCYKDSDVLINKMNLKKTKELLYYEAKITAAKSLDLRQRGITGNFDKKHYLSIHYYLFEDIYPFAGKLREENISKGEFRFASWEYIESEHERLLEEIKNEKYFEGTTKETLANRLAYYLSEFNVLHPFREGNGRTNREFIRQLALKNKYKLNFGKIEPEKILKASIKSIVDYSDLESIILESLEK